MLIPITFNAPTKGLSTLPPAFARISDSEILLVELQGSLEVEAAKPSDRDGKLVGKLGIDAAGKTATLRIGHHLLEGRVTQLAKPLAVLHRPNPTEDAMQVDGDGEQPREENETGWDAVAVIKRKIVFSKRPTPIVGRPANS
ncbi:hypothetical protein MKEN_00379700 [Mycena kentingensis (nom. inval.)]|nr:hypothetical protein MKEN_00379700 [Mycena kentingensis (nom. inval.)]